MNFMKVLDQTVREIKREVNLKVLMVPEIEQKVLDATDDEPWGPHGTVLAEIAQGTKKYTECQMIMNVLWTRLAETGKNWRNVYKALAVIEYLVGNGSERAVDDIVEHTYQIASLSSFEHVDSSGKDVGINVRKKSETIVSLLNDKDKIQEARNKAATTRTKYIGLSSSGHSYKSAAASVSGGSFKSSDRNRSFGNTRDSYSSNDSYKGKDQYGEDKFVKTTSKSKREPSRHLSKKQDTRVVDTLKTSSTASKTKLSSSQNAPSNKYDDDFDDFNPRGISSASRRDSIMPPGLCSKPSAASNQVDLFSQNLVDFSDEQASVPTDNSTSANKTSDVDLFADAVFVSTVPGPDPGKLPAPQTDVDLFASEPAPANSTSMDLFASQPAPSVSTTMDFFSAPNPVPELEEKSSKPDTNSNMFDPFAAIPMSNFDNLASHTDPTPIASAGNSPSGGSHVKSNRTSIDSNPPPKKEAFQVKSGIWSDSLNRGLIDLNITGPKKVNLADIGIVGGLMDASGSKEKGPFPSSFDMGIARGAASGVSKPEVSNSTSTPMIDDDFFSSLSSQQPHI